MNSLYIMTQYHTKLHKIWLIPLDLKINTLAIGTGIIGGGVNAIVGGGIGVGAASFVDFLTDPIVYVRSLGGVLSARNRDLNPIGLKRNIRQHFGANSNKLMLDTYISPIENPVTFGGSFTTALLDRTAIKFAFLKTAILQQMKFLLIHNNDIEVVTLDLIDYKENAVKPYIYDIMLQATSIRSYDGYPNYLRQLTEDVVLNTVAQNLMPAIIFW